VSQGLSLTFNRSLLIVAALMLPLVAIGFAAVIGETSIPIDVTAKTLANRIFGIAYELDPIDSGVIWEYRVTRALIGICCGASLAVGGVLLQALLRNALAEPYILGISAGASTGMVLVNVIGIGAGTISLSVGAFGGAIMAFSLVAALALRAGRDAGAVILAGIASAQLFNALTALIVAKSSDPEQARAIMFWLMGDLSKARWDKILLAVPITFVGIAIALFYARALDAFAFGSHSAASLGVPVRRVYIILVAVCAFLTAAMVSMVGVVGFVGLVIPHAARFLVGPLHQRLIPVAALIGAVFMVACDIVARIILPGSVLPIGVITALVGAPAFALILCRRKVAQ